MYIDSVKKTTPGMDVASEILDILNMLEEDRMGWVGEPGIQKAYGMLSKAISV